MSFSFHVPTNFVFGQGAIQKLHKQRLPGKKALIVISAGKSTRANGYLDIVLAIMTISADEIAAGMPSLEEVSFFDLLDELEGIAVLIDEGALAKPLPFTFRLIGDALLGWESADEEDWR